MLPMPDAAILPLRSGGSSVGMDANKSKEFHAPACGQPAQETGIEGRHAAVEHHGAGIDRLDRAVGALKQSGIRFGVGCAFPERRVIGSFQISQ